MAGELIYRSNGLGKSLFAVELARALESNTHLKIHTQGYIQGYEQAMKDANRPLIIDWRDLPSIRPFTPPKNPFKPTPFGFPKDIRFRYARR